MVVNLLYVLVLLSDHWDNGHNPRTKHRRHERCVSFENIFRNHRHNVAVFFIDGISLEFVNFPIPYQTQLVPFAFQVLLKHYRLFQKQGTRRLQSDFHKI